MSLDMSADIMTLLTGMKTMLTEMRAELTAIHAEIRHRPKNLPEPRQFYNVEEVAEKVGRSSPTVREWCRHGQINAVKRTERRGSTALWSISDQEVSRYLNDGLLPIDPTRNRGE
jgi:hypothetical protein